MSITVTKNNIPKDVFNKVRKEFTRGGGSARAIKKSIISDMSEGVSPVRGKRWKKYSQSYKDVIRGLKTFRKVNGKTIVFKGRDEKFMIHNKPISPVNLKLSGALYKSLKVSTTGRLIVVAFENFLALIHNNEGAGKSKAIRRMLPTEPNEKFNEGITQDIENLVGNAVDKVVNRINGQ